MEAPISDRAGSRAAASPNSPRFEALGVAVRQAGRSLFEPVTLVVGAGEVAAVTGPSGCGKTTLLRALAGLIDLDAGQLRRGGETPEQAGWVQWRRSVVYVAQRPVLLDHSVLDNLSRPFEYRSARGRPFDRQAAGELLQAVDLDLELLERPARALSEGQQQRVALVRALLVEPEVLLLDEPTSALDPATMAAVEQLLRSYLARRAAAAIAVTHDPAQASRLGSQTVTLTPCASAPSPAVVPAAGQEAHA